MSAKPKPKRRAEVVTERVAAKRVATKRAASDPARTSLPGIALVIASVLPAALSPTPPPPATTVERPAPTATRRAPTRRTSLAFSPRCELPFDPIKTEGLAVDAVCSEDGNAGDDAEKELEFNAKNNFCAEGDVTPVSYEDFKSLQAASDKIPDLRKRLDTSRDAVSGVLNLTGGARIGEGSLVRYVGFLHKAHYSNVGKGKGENVNCKLTEKEDNDIHIELAAKPHDKKSDPCDGIGAEMSPHFRPEAWAGMDGFETDRPVRVTGPLFYDGLHHQPCRNGKRPNPKRISVWEIHPVYQFEICNNDTLAACDAQDDSQWIPFDQWESVDVDDDEP